MRLLDLLIPVEKRKFYLLLLAALLLAGLELVGVAAVLPFMALLADADAPRALAARQTYGEWFPDGPDFILAVGLAVIALLLVSRLAAALIGYYRQRFVYNVNYRFGTDLMRYYLQRPYTYFLTRNTFEMKVKLADETLKLCQGYLENILNLVAAATVSVVIVVLLLVVDPMVSLLAAVTLGGAYLVIFLIWTPRIEKLADLRVQEIRNRYRIMNELLGGLKAIKGSGAEASFYERFRENIAIQRYVVPRANLIGSTPRYALEAVAFSGVIALTLYLYRANGNALTDSLPTLTLFAVAGYRLLPSLQAAYQSYVGVRNHVPVLDYLYDELREAKEVPFPPVGPPLEFKRGVRFDGVTFRFPNAETPLFDGLSLEIPKGKTVAFVGTTGAGKTTIADLVSGTFTPEAGRILIDNTPLTEVNTPAWKRQIAYVPQEVFLLDASLADNITFGGAGADAGAGAITEALAAAELTDLVEHDLPEGIHTTLGERGVRLSGGQRQRVGLARALYRAPELLILDEATSALDSVTEHDIVRTLEALSGRLTVVVIAHRLSTVRSADLVYLLEAGRVVDHGTYTDLLGRNADFKRMVQLGSTT